MSRIPAIDPTTATGATAELFETARRKMGAVPNVLRVLGNSPAALQAYLTLSEVLAGSRFDARAREAIALAVAGANACDYCASAHGFIAKNLRVGDEEIRRHLEGHSDDPRLDAALQFARAVVDKKGWADDGDLAAARDGGLDDQQIVEVVALTVANILTNYTNHIAGTEIDFPLLSA